MSLTAQEVIDLARDQYNAVGDTFYSDAELFKYATQACMELAIKTKCIRKTFTAVTVASQQEYVFPTYAYAIKRITYDGIKLHPITFREDDALTLSNQSTTATGTPNFYAIWGNSVFLRPIPDDALALKIYSYNKPQPLTTISSIEIPEEYHYDLINYVLYRIAMKDEAFASAKEYLAEWRDVVRTAKINERNKYTGDSFRAVQDIENLPTTIVGSL